MNTTSITIAVFTTQDDDGNDYFEHLATVRSNMLTDEIDSMTEGDMDESAGQIVAEWIARNGYDCLFGGDGPALYEYRVTHIGNKPVHFT